MSETKSINTLYDINELSKDIAYDEAEEEVGEGEGGEGESAEEEPEIYYSEDFISGPILSEESTVPGDILEFDYSYGYDCKRYFNFIVADEKTLIFASGNFINFFNVETKEHWFRRSAFGGGIGHIAKNPNREFPHIAIAENGTNPPIIVYDWPSLEIVCLLKNGTSRSFTHLNYSPDGMLLASQGGEPDHLITIYNWTKSKILLRTKSNVNEVYRVMFSPSVPGQLTTGGLTHIKFWKMVNTFTGLKLQGELGRFGKTEYCDIIGIYSMPDEKVISGTEWGNILVWDEGLIKVEVCQSRNRKCHEAPIVQFYFYEGDLWTIGMDGRINVWFYDTIDQADPSDDYRFVEVEPSYTLCLPGVMFMCIYKQNDDPENKYYFAQDGNGGLWHIHIDTEEDIEPETPIQLYKCHAGEVLDIAACPWGPYLASLGRDGRFQVYHYVKRKLLFVHQYPAKGSAMIWLPLYVQISGDQLVMGFDDGNIRVVVVSIDEKTDIVQATTIQIIKPHNRPITKLSLNAAGTILVSGGEDATIFIFEVLSETNKFTILVPIGYIRVPGTVTYLTWHHKHNHLVLIGCIHGHFLQVAVPDKPQPYTTITYILHLKPHQQRFITYKSQIRRDIRIREIEARKAEKRAKKQIELDRIKSENPGLEIDDEVFLADSESEEELEPLHIPEIPNRILWMQSTDEGTIWLSMGGYDAGYIYEYYIDQVSEIPANFRMICDGDDIEISSFVYNHNKKYLILAMQDGSIRLVKVNPGDWRDLSDYWQLSMHDNYHGFIPRMCFSYDEKYFFSCGHDGNIFSYRFYPEDDNYLRHKAHNFPLHMTPREVLDIDGYEKLSLEEAIVKAEEDRIQTVADEHKRILRAKLANYKQRFENLLGRNKALGATQVISREQFNIDDRIMAHLQENFDAALALVERKLSFQVEKSTVGLKKIQKYFMDCVDILPTYVKGIQNGITVHYRRQRKLSEKFDGFLEMIEKKIREAELLDKVMERPPIIAEQPPRATRTFKRLEYVLNNLSPATIEKSLGLTLARYISKYKTHQQRKAQRKEEWINFTARKPVAGVNDPTDEDALVRATETIGNYPLKSSSDYKVPKHLQETLIKKYKQLLLIRLKQFNMRHNFSTKVVQLHNEKVNLRAYLMKLMLMLNDIHEEIPDDYRKYAPCLPDVADETIEDNLEVVVQLPITHRLSKEKETRRIVKPPKGDLLEKEVLTTELQVKVNVNVKQLKSKAEAYVEPNEILEQCKENDTLWEIEVRDYRRMRSLFNQELILRKIQNVIKHFDNKIEELAHESLQVTLETDFLDNHLLTLNEELCILEEVESNENDLQVKFKKKMENLLDMKDEILNINNQVMREQRMVKQLQAEENEIREQFCLAAEDNKFYDFLRRIFKKKYKPPKVYDPDDSSSESSSSSDDSEEELDAGSIDSRDFGIIRLDENVCPKGCDPALYQKTFDLRSKRHEIERAVQQLHVNIILLYKDLERKQKHLKIIENHLKLSREELELFQREKQHRLNQVRSTVLLKLNQLQNLCAEKRAEQIPNTLLFSKQILSKLYKRVGQLYNETVKQKTVHRKNIMHASRMRTDCKFMQRKIKELKLAVGDSMMRKFGREVDLEELEEAELRMKLINAGVNINAIDDTQLNNVLTNFHQAKLNIRLLYTEELKLWNRKYAEKQTELLQLTRDSTARVDLLAMLNREKNELAKLNAWQQKKKETLKEVADVFKEDIQKLSKVVETQSTELKLLREEIIRLGRKGLPPFEKNPLVKKLSRQSVGVTQKEQALQLPLQIPSSSEFVEEEEHIAPHLKHEALRLDAEGERIARSLVLEMVQSLQCYQDMSRFTMQGLVEEILQDVLKRSSVIEIVENLVALLPVDPTEEQCHIIETTAEQIYCLLQPEVVQDDYEKSVTKILDNIIDDVLLTAGAPHDVIAKLLSELVQHLPIDFLLKRSSLDVIIHRVKDHLIDESTDSAEVVHAVLTSSDFHAGDIYRILDEIIKEVFGIGIDYLFVIH